MNNGKVRIYELSKELNLDNREILDVCEQLSIPAKSHSSTISEEEANRIRSTAEKKVGASATVSAQRPTAPSSSSTVQSRKDKPQPPVKKKQQILEIRRHQPSAEAPNRPEAPVAPTPPPPVDAPPTPSVVTAAAAASTPVAPRALSPKRPQNQKPKADDEAVLTSPPESQPTADIPVEIPEAVAPPPKAVRAPAPEKPPALVGPPVKPSTQSEESVPISFVSPAPVGNASRPVLKKPSQLRQSSREEDGSENGAKRSLVVVKRSAPGENAAAGDGVGGAIAPPARRDRPAIELRKKPVRPPAGSPEEGTGAEGATPPAAGADLLDKRPDRPSMPRSAKRGGRRRDEEEEERESAKAKVPAKGKRRSTTSLDEDDLELDDDLNGVRGEDAAAAAVRLSLARPPKAKSNRPTAKPAAIAAPKKKTAASSENRHHRRDRREQEVQERPEIITLTGSITVSELADQLLVPETEIIKTLFMKGIMTSVNQMLDVPTATMVAEEFDILIDAGVEEAEAKKTTAMLDAKDMDKLQRRPPVVTIMGHVDHGKTTLLDSIRKTKVAQGEAGGITQHIGAYHVDVEHGGKTEQVVFLDTPGHEAFTAMRARGARVTDVAVLVVAADDGVRPQTIEAISHAKAAEVPIVVAINKMDKEGAQVDRVKQELMEYGLVPEEWGGNSIMVPVSALSGENLDTLLEMLILVTEVEDLYANPDRPAKGTVIEANLDKARGPVATLLVQNGTLRVGDVLVAGSVFGKVRAMIDDRGSRVKDAKPSFAVEVLGLSDVPAAGDEFDVYLDEKEARSTAEQRTADQRQSRLQQSMASRRVSLNTLSSQAQEGELKELNLVLKTDVQGSAEAILASLQQLPHKEVQVRVLLSAPGEITETDVDLAAASNAVIIGFNTTFASGARKAADDAGVDVRDYNIIYKLLEDVQGAMEGLLDPEMVEEPLGQVEVRAVFPVGRGTVAGCYVTSGKITRNCRIRVHRNNAVIHEGNLDSLKRMRDDVKEVASGYECGIGLDAFKDWQESDIIEAFRLATKRRTLSV